MVDKRRFQNLERARPERRREPVEEDPLGAARVGSVEAEVPPSTSLGAGGVSDGPGEFSRTGLSRERFEEPAVSLATVAPDEPLFHRCHVCGADNQRCDLVCQHCNADLRTAAQEAFDAKLRQKEQDELRREEARERQRLPVLAVPGQPDPQAELANAFSELVAEEREEQYTPGWRLLRKLPNPWRWVAAGALALLYLCLYWTSARSQGWLLAWIGVGFVGALLFTPPSFWGRNASWWGRRWF